MFNYTIDKKFRFEGGLERGEGREGIGFKVERKEAAGKIRVLS